jgi:hypothetical protein
MQRGKYTRGIVKSKGKGLGGTSDLTLLAPIRPGFIASIESVTHQTRILRVLDTLHVGRTSSHEHTLVRLLSDAVERVGAIHSVRVAVVHNHVLLAVTFDGSWEAYLRVLWQKVGALLDIIFWGTEGYVCAATSPFDAWRAWAQRVQVETHFFYGPPESTARDVLFHRRLERQRARAAGPAPTLAPEVAELRSAVPTAETAVARLLRLPADKGQPDDPALPVGPGQLGAECVRQGLRGLAGLYRLADLYPPGTADGDVLRRAALELLQEFCQLRDAGLFDASTSPARSRFAQQLDWLFPPGMPKVLLPRLVPPLPATPWQVPVEVLADAQGGIVRGYDGVTHGAALLLAFDNPSAAAALLADLDSRTGALTTGSADPVATPGRVLRNIGFSAAGLRACGLDDAALALWPEAFRLGMAARAGLLGDLRHNHPMRWQWPGRYRGAARPPAAETVSLDAVHAVLLVRCGVAATDHAALAAYHLHDAHHPLQPELARLDQLAAAHPGLHLLAAQPLRRHTTLNEQGQATVQEHFGYLDGDGQPAIEHLPGQPVFARGRAHLGEVLLGHDNAADFAGSPGKNAAAPEAALTRNGSFLVLRKYRQNVQRLQQAVQVTVQQMMQAGAWGPTPGVAGTAAELQRLVYGKLMGRFPDTARPLLPTPQAPGTPSNHFDFDADPQGQACPLAAHVRRANPRSVVQPGGRAPWLMRRSMSFGPRAAPVGTDVDADGTDDHAERGLLFMAYNSSLSEQFEVVQRWLVGGNSTGTSSTQVCPIVGVPEAGLPRAFRFEHPAGRGAPEAFRVVLDEHDGALDAPVSPTRLDWGLYLFTPSVTGLRRLRSLARQHPPATGAPRPAAATVPETVLKRGRDLLAALPTLRDDQTEGTADEIERWKIALEDPEQIDSGNSAAVWATVRADHGGLLRTPYGVLVASPELLQQVLDDRAGQYSVSGQLRRMKRVFGSTYLGLDDGPTYRRLSTPVNRAIGDLATDLSGEVAVFAQARASTRHKLDAIAHLARGSARQVGDRSYEVTLDARELVDEVLADLCETWFGLSPGVHLTRSGHAWGWQKGAPPHYPGHFTALSRYLFQPHPNKDVGRLAQDYGQALKAAMLKVVSDLRAQQAGGRPLPFPLAQAVLAHPQHGQEDEFAASTITGVLMGFIPTILGATLNVLREWDDDTRWADLRTRTLATLAGLPPGADDKSVAAALRPLLMPALVTAAQQRPMPAVIWRTVKKGHVLGSGRHAVALRQKEVLALGLVSGTQAARAAGQQDGRLMFGGVRGTGPGTGPTHACPGYFAGLQAVLGTLAGLLGWQGLPGEQLRPGPAPLIYSLDGPAPPANAVSATATSPAPPAPPAPPTPPASSASPAAG